MVSLLTVRRRVFSCTSAEDGSTLSLTVPSAVEPKAILPGLHLASASQSNKRGLAENEGQELAAGAASQPL